MENLLNWTRDSQNRLMFTERIEKYAVFKNPQVRDAHIYTGEGLPKVNLLNQNYTDVFVFLIGGLSAAELFVGAEGDV